MISALEIADRLLEADPPKGRCYAFGGYLSRGLPANDLEQLVEFLHVKGIRSFDQALQEGTSVLMNHDGSLHLYGRYGKLRLSVPDFKSVLEWLSVSPNTETLTYHDMAGKVHEKPVRDALIDPKAIAVYNKENPNPYGEFTKDVRGMATGRRVYLGIDQATFDPNQDGLIIARINSQGALASVGVKDGDILMAIGASRIRDGRDYEAIEKGITPNTPYTARIRRGERDFKVRFVPQVTPPNLGRIQASAKKSARS